MKWEEVCCTAQSMFHDHVPAKKLGLESAWIDREGDGVEGMNYGEMAEAVVAERNAQ